MLEKIKELLGEELAGQVEAALKGKGKDGRDIDLVIGNDGSYVPAEKLETERQARTSAETALKNAAAALKGVGGSGDPAKIADDVGGSPAEAHRSGERLQEGAGRHQAHWQPSSWALRGRCTNPGGHHQAVGRWTRSSWTMPATSRRPSTSW